MLERAQTTAAEGAAEVNRAADPEGPRQIQILDDSDALTEEERQAEALRKEVDALREELKKLK